MLFEKAYEKYLLYVQKRHKKQGFDTIANNFNKHILPFYKGKVISFLVKSDFLCWQEYILAKNFSNNFNRNLYYEFSAFLNYCVKYSFITENYLISCGSFPKKIENKKVDFYNIFEFFKFYSKINSYEYKIFFWIMFFCGLRPSETMAIRYSDISFCRLHVIHSIHRKGKRELDTPKNQSSIRYVNISLFTYFKLLTCKRKFLKNHNVSDGFICGGLRPLSPTSIDRIKKVACEKANLRVITQHQFRHSYATRLIHKKVPIDYVSKNLGHSKVSTTVDVYLHNQKKTFKVFD